MLERLIIIEKTFNLAKWSEDNALWMKCLQQVFQLKAYLSPPDFYTPSAWLATWQTHTNTEHTSDSRKRPELAEMDNLLVNSSVVLLKNNVLQYRVVVTP